MIRRTARRPDHTAATTMLAAAGLIAVAAGVPGCQSIGSDVEDAFGGLFGPSPTEAVVWTTDTDPDLRRRGVLLLGNAVFGGEEPYVRLYRDYAVNERNPLVKAAAIRALARHGEVADARIIATQLTHENRQVRWEAARGLQRLHEPAVVPDLLERLRDPDEDVQVRVATATALGQYGSDRAFQGLVAALEAPELAVNHAAAASLRQLTGRDIGIDPTAWLRWYRDAAGDSQRLAGASGFRYPTYERDLGFFEQLAFWNPPVREFPGPPLGLEPGDARRTYEDAPADTPDAGDAEG
ncbi:MAG: HEAT repeat domain-containing protein [Planctomycetota bacterium]